jgi:hypothetical protein
MGLSSENLCLGLMLHKYVFDLHKGSVGSQRA